MQDLVLTVVTGLLWAVYVEDRCGVDCVELVTELTADEVCRKGKAESLCVEHGRVEVMIEIMILRLFVVVKGPPAEVDITVTR